MKSKSIEAISFFRRQALAFRVATLLAIFGLINSVRADGTDLFDAAGSEITANKAKLLTLLGIVFIVVMVGVAYKLVKRGANKV